MAEKVLIVDDDVETLRLVGLMLERQGYQITAADNGERAIKRAQADRPDLVLLDVMMPDMSGYDVAKSLRANEITANVPIIMFTAKAQVDDKVEGLESGADAYLTKPTQPRELLAQVKALLARSKAARTAQAMGQAPATRGLTIGVLSAKGGLGVSTLVTNLGVILRKLTRESVVVADFRPGSSDISVGLGYTNSNGVPQLLRKEAKSISPVDIQRELVSHQSGIHVFISPQRPRDAVYAMRLEQYQSIARLMPSIAKYVLLDLGPSLPPLTQMVLKYCDSLLVVMEPSPTNVQQTKQLIDDLIGLNVGKARIQVVLINRVRSSLQLNWSDAQDELGHPISTVITPAPDLAYKASETNTPMVLQQPSSLTAEQFTKLASSYLRAE